MRLAEPVEMRAGLAAKMEEVLEPRRRDERGLRAGSFEERVRGDRRPVGEPLHGGRAHRPRGREHRLRLIGLRRHLRRREPVTVQEHGVGERPADVDAEDRHGSELREDQER